MKLFLNLSQVCLFLALSASLSARIVLSPIFSDNMVLQQHTTAPIWGKATPNQEVKVITSWNKKKYVIHADASGRWVLKVKTPNAGGPYSISLFDGERLVLNNVLIGEVWICSGQSNMEMPLAGWGKIKNYEQEIALANYPNIRLLHIEKVNSPQPLSDIKDAKGGWKVCTPVSIPDFSALAYFFGRNLYKDLNIPIGLINTSWGGSPAEAWTSAEALSSMPDFKEEVDIVSHHTDQEQVPFFEEKLKKWNDLLMRKDFGFENGIAVGANPELSDREWPDMSLPGSWEDRGHEGFDGYVWFRKTIDIPAEWEGKDLTISLGHVDDNDWTYFNGEKVGATQGYYTNRVYSVPARLVKKGKAVVTVRVEDNGGGGGLTGNREDMRLVLAGKTSPAILLDQTWKYKVAIDIHKFPKAPHYPVNDPNRPSVLFNAMIKPLAPYAIKGFIWYQGESNVGLPVQYQELFPKMIKDWRKQWNKDLPFYFVQLASYMTDGPNPSESAWAELRDAQRKTLQLEHTGMAVTIDVGDAFDIHPKNKQEVGSRLALIARANTYGEKIPFSGPIYQSCKIEENKVRISFKHTNGGLKIKDGSKLKGFAIAGADRQYYWAEAVIVGDEVVVTSPEVDFPVAVRYAWGNRPSCNLYNGADLPASPFRTDNW